MTIKAETNELKQLGNDLVNQADLLNNDIKKLYNVINNMSLYWTGIDAQKFTLTMQEQNLKELEKLSQIINEYGKYLTKVPECYELLEEIFESKTSYL